MAIINDVLPMRNRILTPKELYVSVDIETDGPIPGINNLLSLGAVAYDYKGKELGSFTTNFKPVGVSEARTMEWWSKYPVQYAKATESPVEPLQGMDDFRAWLRGFPGSPVCVAGPAGFDFTYLYWYLIRFGNDSPFSFSCVDIKTLAMVALCRGYKGATKRNYLRHWFPKDQGLAHEAVSDARAQGHLFFEILKTVETSING